MSAPPAPGERADGAERATFIVRLWRRASGDDWQGQVEHVQSGERRAAPTLAATLAAVRRWLVKGT